MSSEPIDTRVKCCFDKLLLLVLILLLTMGLLFQCVIRWARCRLKGPRRQEAINPDAGLIPTNTDLRIPDSLRTSDSLRMTDSEVLLRVSDLLSPLVYPVGKPGERN